MLLKGLSTKVDWQAIGRSCFTLVLMLDNPDFIDGSELGELFRNAITQGVRVVLCGGSAGESAHDVCDWKEVMMALDGQLSDDDTGVLTTWHDNEQLVDILWQAYHSIMCPNDKGNKWPVVVALMESDRRVDELHELAKRIGVAFDELLDQEEDE